MEDKQDGITPAELHQGYFLPAYNKAGKSDLPSATGPQSTPPTLGLPPRDNAADSCISFGCRLPVLKGTSDQTPDALSVSRSPLNRHPPQLSQLSKKSALRLKRVSSKSQVVPKSQVVQRATLLQAAPLGIDTMQVYVPVSNGMIAHDTPLKVWQHGKTGQRKRVLWTDNAGRRVEGMRAYWTGEGIGLRIRPLGDYCGAGSIGCFISFSVSGICGHGDNYAPAGWEATVAALDLVQQKLKQIGVTVDIRQATPSRLDMFVNLVLDKPCAEYLAVFDHLKPSRMKTDKYPASIVQGNKQHQLMAYDKRAEREERNRDVSSLEDNVLRLEYRLFCAAKCRSILGGKTVRDLLDNFDALPEIYASALCKHWFRFNFNLPRSVQRREPEACAIKAVARHLVRTGARSKTGAELSIRDHQRILRRIVDAEGIEAYKKHLASFTGLSRQYRSNAAGVMKAALLQQRALIQPEFAALYQELYTKAITDQRSRCAAAFRPASPAAPPAAPPGASPATPLIAPAKVRLPAVPATALQHGGLKCRRSKLTESKTPTSFRPAAARSIPSSSFSA